MLYLKIVPNAIKTEELNVWLKKIHEDIIEKQKAHGDNRGHPYYGAIGGGLETRFVCDENNSWQVVFREALTKNEFIFGSADASFDKLENAFCVNDVELRKVQDWTNSQTLCGLTFGFTSTSLGGITNVYKNDVSLCITDFSDW